MEDEKIIELYFERDENAIAETASKYGNYLFTVANNVLGSEEDAKESVNDAYMVAWNAIPPQKPKIFSAFLAKITRNISIKKWKSQTAQKRGGGEAAVAFEELSEFIPDNMSVASQIEANELSEYIMKFLHSLPKQERKIFVCRYWYLDSISDISKNFCCSESKVKSLLFRTRKKLLSYLKKEGVFGE